MISILCKDRIWAWDFRTSESLCWTKRVIISIRKNRMVIDKTPSDFVGGISEIFNTYKRQTAMEMQNEH